MCDCSEGAGSSTTPLAPGLLNPLAEKDRWREGERGWPQNGLRVQLVVRACAIGTCSSDCWFYWLPKRRACGCTVPVPLAPPSLMAGT